MLKFVLLFSFTFFIFQAQGQLYEVAKDSDAILLTSKEIAFLKINSIEFIEALDTACFKNYPLPPASVRFIKHECNFNFNGLCENYSWNFYEDDSIRKNEVDAPSGRFFIPNEYTFIYEENKVKEIHISDASMLHNISYHYDSDSIYQKYSYYLPDKTITEKNISYSKSALQNHTILSHTGNKKTYFPKYQTINLGSIHPYSIFINDIPVSSFFFDKYEQKRFFIEINPGLSIFFEIVE